MAQVSAADKQKANELKDKGNKVLQSGQIDEAIDLYSEAINLDPTNHLFYSNRAACYVKQSNWKGALADAQKCVEIDPTFGKGYLRLGNALHALKRVEDAINAYKKGLTFDKNDAATNDGLKKGLAESQSLWNDMQSVKAAKSDKNDSESTRKAAELKQRGNDALAKKEYKKAIDCYSEAINIDLDNPVIYSNRSAAYANLKMWSEAYADASRCNFLDPKFAKGWQRKGYAAMNLKKYDEAKLAFNRGLDLEHDNEHMKKGLQEVLAAERNNPKKK
jgi:tetratricopeptide (TPR) repeat protein